MARALSLPRDPVARLRAILEQVAARKAWFQGWSSLRFATIGLLAEPGSPGQVAEQLFTRAEGLHSILPWWSSLRSDIRFCLAAMLVTRDASATDFGEALEVCRRRFREASLPRSEVHEGLACLVLMEHAPSGVPTAAQVASMVAVLEGMRGDHPWLTGRDDYAAAALLASTGDSPTGIATRSEALYRALRDLRFSSGNRLQLATQLLYLAPDPDHVLARRFRALYDGFKREGLWMFERDLDEIAVLASLDLPPQAVVRRVLADRRRLREVLEPRPTPQVGFELASATTFLSLAKSDPATGSVLGGLQVAQLVALVQAQQAAMAAAAAGGAGAAGASG